MGEIKKGVGWKDIDTGGRKTLHLAFLDTDTKGITLGIHLVRMWIPEDDQNTDYDIVLKKYKGYSYVQKETVMLERTWVRTVLAFSKLRNFLSASEEKSSKSTSTKGTGE